MSAFCGQAAEIEAWTTNFRDPTALLGTAQSLSSKSYIFCIATPHTGVEPASRHTQGERDMDHP